ncbi:sensor domain-containing protein [Segniliparus rugosus]|uniref:PknH-like extracellular domain-containing protein n=1 Tax=Segniliparus rugosus (strain ATCC BAA-974 / DSM 45345 / CCUG 50838 / CIP 108380 / JCM 13579 / CDC 945) TaxID=679197 RepID=E5XM12_SEGRC|nr:sensor domain-containing protein [Segniliparus rugosus]EFV14618.1 hypothetical protein HMPREF9336_00531 [Segniliparus rugosus ATCC BAA-974]
MTRARIAAFAILALATVSACDRTGAGLGASTARADPTTTQISPGVFPPEKVDTLLLSLDEVNRTVAPGRATKFFNQAPIEDKPFSQAQPPTTSCGKALAIGTVYSVGENWSSFRSSEYDATQNVYIRLIVAVYPSEQLAEEAFSRIGTGVRSCATNDEFSLDAVVGNYAQWHSNIPASETHSLPLGLHNNVTRVRNVLIQIESSDPESGAKQASGLIAQVANKIT